MCEAPIPPCIRTRINATLDQIERQHGVRILLAVESGSRAWGFASPDSDFDVRFLYVRRLPAYLSLIRPRDVIELPIVDDLDINGWDLGKALTLLCKANPVLFEWLASPILYRADEAVLADLRALVGRVGHRRAATHHYHRLAVSNWSAHIEGRAQVRLKKYFYALRPACALAWLRHYPERPVPMALAELLAGIAPAADLCLAVEDLLQVKQSFPEMGEGGRIAALDWFIQDEIARGTLDQAELQWEGLVEAADALFREIVLAG